MGSGLKKCFVTKSYIPEGMPVVIFPVINNRTYTPVVFHHEAKPDIKKEIYGHNDSVCYPNWLYSFYGTYFTAIMDDYGRSEIEDSKENIVSFKLFLEELLQNSYITEEGENEYHEKAFNIVKLLKSKKIKISNLDSNKRYERKIESSLSIKVVNSLYQEILELADSNRIVSSQHESFVKFAVCLKEAFKYGVSTVPLLNYLEASKEEFIELLPKTNSKNRYLVSGAIRRLTELRENHGSMGYYHYMQSLIDTEKGKLTKKDAKLILTKCEFVFDFSKFMIFLNDLSIDILPMSGYQQDYHNETGNEYVKMLIKMNKKVDEFIKEKYGDEE